MAKLNKYQRRYKYIQSKIKKPKKLGSFQQRLISEVKSDIDGESKFKELEERFNVVNAELEENKRLERIRRERIVQGKKQNDFANEIYAFDEFIPEPIGVRKGKTKLEVEQNYMYIVDIYPNSPETALRLADREDIPEDILIEVYNERYGYGYIDEEYDNW